MTGETLIEEVAILGSDFHPLQNIGLAFSVRAFKQRASEGCILVQQYVLFFVFVDCFHLC